jgi:hypothetical protein
MGPKDLKKAAKRFYRSKQPFMVMSPPGVGKSSIIRQAADELGIQFRDVRLNMFDPVDLRGIPMPDLKTGKTRWMTPDFFPTEGSGIVLFDEITAATTAVQAAAYQITLDRKLGEYELPPGWSVMAAGNSQSDRAVSYKMPSALVSRLNMQTLEVSQKDFEEYGANTGRIIPEIVAFLRFKPGMLMNFDPAKWKDNTPFACPRTWEFLSHDMKENNNETSLQIVNGFVGPHAAPEFYGFLKVYQELPSMDEILAKPMTAKVPTDPAPLYAIATALARHVTPKNADNVFQYLSRMPNEFEMCSVKDMAVRNLDMTNCKAFNQWLIKHGHLFA